MGEKRDNKGQFAKGHSGNPGGRPRTTISPGEMATVMQRLTQEEWDRIVDVGIARAQSGDVAWARFLANYRWGKPIERRIITEVHDIELQWPEDDEGIVTSSP